MHGFLGSVFGFGGVLQNFVGDGRAVDTQTVEAAVTLHGWVCALGTKGKIRRALIAAIFTSHLITPTV